MGKETNKTQQEDLSKLSMEELKQKLKFQKWSIIFFLIAMGVMLCSALIITIKTSKFTPFLILPFTFFPLLVITVNSRKKYLAELERRGG